MNDDQITALAREYAELTDGSPADIAYITAIAENTIRFLLRRFCLVEKETVKEQYAKWMQQFCDTRDIAAKEYAGGWISALESIFPEIAKD